jgi:hypothetical protein
MRTVIADLLTYLVTEDEPAAGLEEEQSTDETSPGLQYFLSHLRKGYLRLLQILAETDEPMDLVRQFTGGVKEVVRDLGSYIDAKRQLPHASTNIREYKPRTEASDDLHARNARLAEKVALLHEQCRRGILDQILNEALDMEEDLPDHKERAQG